MKSLPVDPERLFETILGATPDFAYIFDLDYRVRYANPALLAMWGFSYEDTIHKGFRELNYPEWHALKHEEEIRTVVATKAPIRGEVDFTGTLGKRYYDYIFVPVFDGEGQVVAVAGTTRDVTERYQLDQAQRESETLIRTVVDAALDGVVMTTDEGIIEEWNKPAERIFGWSREQAIGRQMSELIVPADHRDMHSAGMTRYLSTRVSTILNHRIEVPALHRDGHEFPVELTVTAQHIGEKTYFTAFVRDITEEKAAKEALIEARNAAEAANIAKTEFLANMSHEIRTPMNAVIGLSHLLSRTEPLSPRQKEFIQTLQMSADSLLSLINDLLDIAKIEQRSVELERVPFDLSQLVQEVISMMTVRAREKDLAFSFEGECVLRQNFIGDPTRMRQILTNLCSNAVKFTHHGGVHIEATCDEIEDRPGWEMITIMIEDTGIGIASEKLDTIFEKFVQGDSSTTRQYGGTGLGLAITKTLTEIMGGQIAVTSKLERGSVFTIRLPLERGDGPTPAVRKAATEAPGKPVTDKTVLIVEDNPANVLVATSLLDEFGYGHEVAMSGLSAIHKLARGGHYALVLMDVQMHGMNGLDATVRIRRHEEENGLPRLPIIGLTAHALMGDRERCLAVGMDDYLSKPLNPVELKEKIESLLGADAPGE